MPRRQVKWALVDFLSGLLYMNHQGETNVMKFMLDTKEKMVISTKGHYLRL